MARPESWSRHGRHGLAPSRCRRDSSPRVRASVAVTTRRGRRRRIRPRSQSRGRRWPSRSSRSAASSSTSRSGAASSSGRSAMVQAVDGVDLDDPPRRDARARRRVGLRQDHRRPAAAAADRADGRPDPVRRHGHHEPQGRGAQALPAADADHLPGPVRVARPADADRRQHRRGPAHPRHRHARRSGARRSGG